jgi:pimeloyl-ACP methyl ester carboxylesterase
LTQAVGIHYEEHGGGAHGPPLVFVHGAGGSRLHWPPALRRRAGWHALSVDLPGHGESPPGDEVSLDAYAQRLRAWWSAVGVGRPILVGHSMGSSVALTVALETPGIPAALVLVGAAPRLKVNPGLLEDAARPDTFDSAVDRIMKWSFAPQAEARLVELARARLVEAGPAGLTADLTACDGFDVTSRLAEIRLPTLLVVGRMDRMTPPELSDALHAGISGSRLVVVEEAGHMVMLERPEVVAMAVEEFVQDLSDREKRPRANGAR